jgi:uncharacterized DUF497 family protein
MQFRGVAALIQLTLEGSFDVIGVGSTEAAADPSQHGVVYAEAATPYRDPRWATARDPDHSVGEDRFMTFGVSNSGRLLDVLHAEMGNILRIISSRPATKEERRIYEEG